LRLSLTIFFPASFLRPVGRNSPAEGAAAEEEVEAAALEARAGGAAEALLAALGAEAEDAAAEEEEATGAALEAEAEGAAEADEGLPRTPAPGDAADEEELDPDAAGALATAAVAEGRDRNTSASSLIYPFLMPMRVPTKHSAAA